MGSASISGMGADQGGDRSRDRRQRFGRLLAEALSARASKQEDLATMLGTTQSSVSAWVTGRYEPSAETVFAIERGLSLGPGHLSRVLGYLPVEAVGTAPGVEDAIAQSTLIDDAQKQIVLAVYRAVVENGAARPRRAPDRDHRTVERLPGRNRVQRRTG
jgi:transcriptional regulator with XRE-family HTH domain